MSTRLGLSHEFIRFYSTHNTGRVINGYNDKENNTSLDPFVLVQIFVTIIFTIIVLLFFCGCCCAVRQLLWRHLERSADSNPSRSAGLWSNADSNPSRSASQLSNVNANPSRSASRLSNVNVNPSRSASRLSNVNANPSRSASLSSSVNANPFMSVAPWSNMDPILLSPIQPTAPPMLPENLNLPGDSDVPPDYSAVAGQKHTTSVVSDNSNRYPKVVGGKKAETPPPDYMTVAPFK